MKNIIQRGVCLLLLLAVTAALSACGQSGAKNTIYAVEAGSAGEEVEFVVIDWGQKVNELNSQAIDVVWNGMTLTDGVQNAMTCTPAYCRNAQVVVVPAA